MTTARTGRAGPAAPRLSRRARKLVRFLHLLTALGWLGVDAALGVLTVTAWASDDPRTVAACYTALAVFAVPLLLTFGVGALGTGVVLGLGTGMGLVRHWWTTAKLGLNVVLVGLVPVLLLPRVREAAQQSLLVDATLAERLDRVPVDLLFPPVVSGVALVVAALLGTYRPWGRTPFGDRVLAGSAGRPSPAGRR